MKKQNTKTTLNYKSAKEMRIYIAEKYGINSTEELKNAVNKSRLADFISCFTWGGIYDISNINRSYFYSC